MMYVVFMGYVWFFLLNIIYKVFSLVRNYGVVCFEDFGNICCFKMNFCLVSGKGEWIDFFLKFEEVLKG